MYSDTRQLPYIGPCLPTSHCPQAIAEVKPAKVSVPSTHRSSEQSERKRVLPCSANLENLETYLYLMLSFSLAVVENLDLAEKVPHSTSSHGVSVSHPRWRTDPRHPPGDTLRALHGIPEDQKGPPRG